MQDFRRLDVWEKAHELVVIVYRATTNGSERRYPGLASQLRRAASSIPANIAEGCVGNLDHADVGINGAKRVVRRFGLGGGQRVEETRLAHIGEADDSET